MAENSRTFNLSGNSKLVVYGATAKPKDNKQHHGQSGQSTRLKQHGQTSKKERIALEPYQIPPKTLCHYQDACTKLATCKYLHVSPHLLEGCTKPYRLCRNYPQCHKKKCTYVHFDARTAPTNQHPASGETEQPGTQRIETTGDMQIAMSFQSGGMGKKKTD